MIEVKRYPAKMFTPETPCVHASDYDAALARETALREELSQSDNLLGETASKQFQAEADLYDAQQRLTAAEQWNANAEELL